MTHPIIHALVELGSEPPAGSNVDPAQAPSTEEVLKSMLTENTGRHMLDSGGAFGRHWERNQGEDFGSHPEVEVEWYLREASKYDRDRAEGELTVDLMVTLDVYHFLKDRLEYLPELDAAFHEFANAEERKGDGWLECIDAFTEAHNLTFEGGDRPMTVNTYNNEDALSQVLQYTICDDPDEDAGYGARLVFLQIHGGADVRGGYTEPRVFRAWEWELMDNARLTMFCQDSQPVENPHQLDLCTGQPVGFKPCEAVWDSDNAGYTWYDAGNVVGGTIDLDKCPVERGTEGKQGVIVVDEDSGKVFCPCCGSGTLGIHGPFTSY